MYYKLNVAREIIKLRNYKLIKLIMIQGAWKQRLFVDLISVLNFWYLLKGINVENYFVIT